MVINEQKKRLLKAKIAVALQNELGRDLHIQHPQPYLLLAFVKAVS